MIGFTFAALSKFFKATYHFFTVEIYGKTKGKVLSTTGAFM